MNTPPLDADDIVVVLEGMRTGQRWYATRSVTVSVMLLGAVVVARQALGFSLSSTAFTPDGDLPTKYTCDGSDTAQSQHTGDLDAAVSPPLAWQDPPPGTKAFALIVDDIDAPRGSWVQWIIYDIQASVQHAA